MALQVKAPVGGSTLTGGTGVVRPICEPRTLPSSGRFRFWNSGQAMLPETAKRCFKSHTIGFPPIKQPLALEAEALALGAPEKWGRKRRYFHVLLNAGKEYCWIAWSAPVMNDIWGSIFRMLH
jgi:hypothetical protein